jgi:hypothetical protein
MAMPDDITWEEMKKLCDARFSKVSSAKQGEPGSNRWRTMKGHELAIKRAGGYLEFTTLLLYKSLRLGQHSTTVAEQMGITPVHVRQHVYRANIVAEDFGFVVHERPHKSKGVFTKTSAVRPNAEQYRQRRIELGQAHGEVFDRIQQRKARRTH